MSYRVTMVCKEVWRAVKIVHSTKKNLEAIKDIAWADFDRIAKADLEQENFTKVERMR